jgi:hypothetical protein
MRAKSDQSLTADRKSALKQAKFSSTQHRRARASGSSGMKAALGHTCGLFENRLTGVAFLRVCDCLG